MSYTVRISDTNNIFEVSPEETILDAALRADIKLPHECTYGSCGTCRVQLQEGSVHYQEFPMALTEEEHAQGYALACQAHPDGDVVITPASNRLDLPEPVQLQATVLSVESLTATISKLILQLPEDADCDYRAGQHMNIHLADAGKRSFSMASAFPFGNEVEFHIRHIPGGIFTEQHLRSLAPGDRLDVEIPRGTFCYHPDDWRPMIFIATGTGIAPIRAILESLLDDDDCPPVSLYWGMRTEDDLYVREEMESWAERLFEFNFVPVLSRATESWPGRQGHVQDAVAHDFNDLSEHAFYICGSPQMVADAKHAILKLGGESAYIYSDSFTLRHNDNPIAA